MLTHKSSPAFALSGRKLNLANPLPMFAISELWDPAMLCWCRCWSDERGFMLVPVRENSQGPSVCTVLVCNSTLGDLLATDVAKRQQHSLMRHSLEKQATQE